MRKLFEYQLPLKQGGMKKGLILQENHSFAEISPLQGRSKESLIQAKQEALHWIRRDLLPSSPSVLFAIRCLQTPLRSIHLPLCSLGDKKGFQTIKLKLGHLPLKEAIALTRKHLGKTLRIDCNRAWSLKDALFFASHFQPGDFDYLEEPVQTFVDLIVFSEKTGFPIAVDESIEEHYSQIPTLKALVIKPSLVPTIPQTTSYKIILSSSYESGLGLLHIAHLHPNSFPVGLDTYDLFKEDLLTSPIQTSDGFFSWEKKEPLLKQEKLCAVL